MKRVGIFAPLAAGALMLPGCILAPIEESDGFDPFFADPSESSFNSNFIEVGNYQPNSYLPPAASRHCSLESDQGKVGSPCWFFPVLRVY